MNIKRKFKRREVSYDIVNNELDVKDIYEDVLEESLFKKVIKDYIFIISICVSAIQLVGIIICDKWMAVLCTATLVFFVTTAVFRYKYIRDIEE